MAFAENGIKQIKQGNARCTQAVLATEADQWAWGHVGWVWACEIMVDGAHPSVIKKNKKGAIINCA